MRFSQENNIEQKEENYLNLVKGDKMTKRSDKKFNNNVLTKEKYAVLKGKFIKKGGKK